MKIKKQNLQKFINYYYSYNREILPSIYKLSISLEISYSETRTLLSIFEKCDYLYVKKYHYYLFLTKRHFQNNFKIKILEEYYYFYSDEYVVKINKYLILQIIPDLKVQKITNIKEIIYLIFLLTLENNTYICPKIYYKNNKMWMQKACFLNKSSTHLYSCAFTQNKDYINLTNQEIEINQ